MVGDTPPAAALVPVPRHVKVGAAWAGLSVLEAVRRAFEDLTSREIFKKARMGEVLKDGKRCRPLDLLAEGDILTVILHLPHPPRDKPVLRRDEWVRTPVGPLWIVREDEDLLALSKASGCASHPALGRSGDTLIERVRRYLDTRPEDEFQPALANRLDIETSGIVLVGKTKLAQRRLGWSLQHGEVDKRYLALVALSPPGEGEITSPLERRPDSRDIASYKPGHPRLSPRIQEAHTRFRTLFRAEHPVAASLVEVELLTGRNHQIRRHFAELGHPVALDRRYGDREFNRALREACGLERMFLHAYRVALPHPATGAPLELFSPLPEDLADCLRALGADPQKLAFSVS
jgi:23S rRNA pseudouridine955/2504/2580 synthase